MKYFGPEYGIAPWKINSPIERFLSHRADNSEFWKKIYVMYYRIFDPDYYKGGLIMIDKILVDNKLNQIWGGGKSRQEIVRDMIYCLHRFGCEFNEYITYEFYRLNTEARDSFICSKNRWKYYLYFNKTRNNPIFDDKNLTYQKFVDYIKREYCFISSMADETEFYQFSKNVKQFIIKPVGGSGGRGVMVANSEDYNINYLLEQYPKGFLAEEIVKNHPDIARVNPSSLNTIRVVTIRSESDVVILFSFIRFGRKGSVVDNAFCGGIIGNIDIETGIVTSACTEMGERYIIHPDSKIPIVGFLIPFWEKVKDFARQLALVVPECRYVGWDLAVTNEGVIMIEANCKGEFVNQMATARGIKKEIEELMK